MALDNANCRLHVESGKDLHIQALFTPYSTKPSNAIVAKASMVASTRRPLFFNPEAKTSVIPISSPGDAPLNFHQSLPGYQPTKLVSLDSVAEEAGVKSVLVKFEGQRLGLPSFKILGASWGTINAVTQKLGMSSQSDHETVKSALKAIPTTLFAATDGNHGMAVAHMGTLLGIPTKIFVPVGLHSSAIDAIEKEGGLVIQINASYDETVQKAFRASGEKNGVFVQDTAFPGYEETANWVVEGYSTLHLEIDEALAGVSPNLVVAPVGVDSFAHSVVNHYKAEGRDTKVLTVEPDTAACLYKSLVAGEATPIETMPTILAGLNCGTVSSIAWPILKSGVDATGTVNDFETHVACKLLQSLGVSAGPCGAASLAALRRLTDSDKAELGLNSSSTVVLLCTEGHKEYDDPRDVSLEDTLSLTQTLVQINSAVPGTGNIRGAAHPAVCTITIERRTDGGETVDQVKEEMDSVLRTAAQNSPGLKYETKVTFARSAFEIRRDHPLVTLLAEEYRNVTGKEIKMRKEAFWTDCALIADKEMPVVMFGPWGEGLHAKTEWVEIESLRVVSDTLIRVMKSFAS
ncbi:hypothetical protein CORC01_04492 [Colletotrichum orchidophilum]|uniref:Tryptophan synthase beta chain-like PALP domain-containing protein n=1 Tax=Colletotrichum orchidophilum TaxID=1209926 RepID=A0A1G4BG74_9PEZI|nr:uncharacterized protein CORC01_04492 [Colletotrichum orchidophilum]OHF00303.1 hypothetical protein CORC01_04492 [Colletotrichum orchidophilum]